MILYLDTSALVKLYVEKEGSDRVESWVERADLVATVQIAYAEVRVALARLRREGALAPVQPRRAVANFDLQWDGLTAIEVSDAMFRRAGALAEARQLRGYDAVHLSTGLLIRDAKEAPVFGCFDERLIRAARREGLAAAS